MSVSFVVLHVAQISFFLDAQKREPNQLLSDWHSLPDIAEAVGSADAQVSVIQACWHSAQFSRAGVDYYFLRPNDGASSLSQSTGFAELIHRLSPDVLHVHGLDCSADIVRLRKLAPHTPILLQDHANRPPRLWRRQAWRRGCSAASGISFCAREQQRPFERAGLLAAHLEVFEIAESTSHFAPGDRAAARRITRLEGDPCLLWVGHLDDNKDPLTVLDGVSSAARSLPKLQLWCCFAFAPLLQEVQNRIVNDPLLNGRVHLLGSLPREQVERLMQAADVFVSGSHSEGSGYALIEALACGLPPVVTNIPSFRSLTAQGMIGCLWEPGDSHGCCAALVAVAAMLSPDLRRSVRAHFERELSPPALGKKFAQAYLRLLRGAGDRR